MAAPSPNAPRAVLLDLDDTLVPWQTLTHWQWAWKPRGPVLGERHAHAAIKRSVHAWDRRRWAGLLGEEPPTDLPAYRAFLGSCLTEVAGHPLPSEESAAVVERFLHPAHEFEQFPEAQSALKALQGLSVRVGVSTYLPQDVARTMLRRSGLPEELLVLSDADGPELSLPRATGFRAAAKKLDARPSQTIYVGDLFWSDVRAAARTGMRSVLLDRHDTWPRVTSSRVRTLTELAELVRSPPPAEPAGAPVS
ncbi:MAG: HAD family hydrolase [Thermoplasmata archaeon]|nr:HAD family hydrolase [Thermoplasmata archaeon]